MPSEIVVRPFIQDDVEEMVAIALAAWAPLFHDLREQQGEELFAALHPDWRAAKGEGIRRACQANSGARTAVAEKDGRVVGFITFYQSHRAGIGEIGNNAVHPDFQGRGIGPRLYRHVFRELRRAGVRFVEVGTGGDTFHARARKAYEKVGFAMPYPGVTYYRELTEADEEES